jgi:glutaredoxin 3
MAHVLMYTKTHCWYCRNARRLLGKKNVDYEEIDLNEHPERREEMLERSPASTVPQIFIDGEAIGGYDELKALDKAGELDPKLGIG